MRTDHQEAVPLTRRRLLGDHDIAALLEAVPDLPLPPEQVRRWSAEAAGPMIDRARQQAWDRLVADGVLRARPTSVEQVPALVEPAVLAALTLPASADLLVRARSWAGGDAVDACLAVSGERGAGTVRRCEVTAAADGTLDRAGVEGLELSAFAAGSLLAEVERAVPPVAGEPIDGRAPVRVGAVRSAAVLAALREGRDAVADDLCGRADGRGAAALDEDGRVPQVLVDLAAHRAGGLDLVVRRPDGAVPPVVAAWWLAGPAWWQVRTVRADDADDGPGGAVGPETADLVLTPTTRSGVVDDVLGLLVAALSASTPSASTPSAAAGGGAP